MEKRFLTLVALVLVMVQGFAVPVDSVKNQMSGMGMSSQRENMVVADGVAERTDFGTFDGFERMDGKTTTESTSSNGSDKIMIYSPDNLNDEITHLSFSSLVDTSETKEIIVKTKKGYSNLTITLEGTDKKMFSVDPPSLNSTDLCHGGAKVKITYKPTAAGSHTANLVIKHKTITYGIVLAKKTISLSGTGKCEIEVNKTYLPFVNAEPNKFRLQCKKAAGKVYLEVKGTNKSYFKVSPTSISKRKAANENIITVTCSVPISVKKASAYILITSDYADAKRVELVYVKRSNGPSSTTSSDDEVQEGLSVEYEEEPEVDSQEQKVEQQEDVTYYVVEAPTADIDEKMDDMLMDVRIFAEDQTIIIESPVQQSAIISDLSGRGRSVRLQVGRNEIPINASGVHVVRVGDKSVKLMLR